MKTARKLLGGGGGIKPEKLKQVQAMTTLKMLQQGSFESNGYKNCSNHYRARCSIVFTEVKQLTEK